MEALQFMSMQLRDLAECTARAAAGDEMWAESAIKCAYAAAVGAALVASTTGSDETTVLA